MQRQQESCVPKGRGGDRPIALVTVALVVGLGCAEPDEHGAGTHEAGPALLDDGGSLGTQDSGSFVLPQSEPNPLAGICTEYNVPPIRASELSLADSSYDYVAVRQWSGRMPSANAGLWTSLDFETVSEVGTACGTATDSECKAKIMHHPIPSLPLYCPQACVEVSVVTTKGNEVSRWSKPDELLSVLGTIDTPAEALLVVASHGYSVHCPSQRPPRYPIEIPVDARPTQDGFEVVATRAVETCRPFVVRRYRLRVTAGGSVEEIESNDFEWPGVCA